jgi:acyl-CoA thioesterase I
MVRLMLVAAIMLGTLALLVSNANAQQVSIVALGASNTYGKGLGKHPGGVDPGRAYPAQLQAMLKAKG